MTTIKLKNGSGAPTAGDLVQGEPALDLTNKRLYTENASGTVIEVGTNPTSLTTGTLTATSLDVTGTVTADGLTVSKSDTSTTFGASTASITVNNEYGSAYGRYAGVNFRIGSGSYNETLAAIHAQYTLYSGNTMGELIFGTRGASSVDVTERMRIDSSGNLLVGKTASSFASAGVEILPDGRVVAGRAGENLVLNRLTTDGDIALFRKDGAPVGSIGVVSGDLYVGESSSNLRFDGENAQILPASTAGATSNGVINLGSGSTRFKNLYLSGSVNNVTASGSTSSTLLNAISGVTNGFHILANSSNQMTYDFNTGLGLKMRLDNAGNLLVGTTTLQGRITVTATGSTTIDCARTETSTANNIVLRNGNGAVGSIQTSGSSTSYNTSSDQRLKENIADADDAGSKIDAIQVRQYDWKVDGSHQDYGMIAQELLEVAPEAVSQGETEEEMMGVDYSKLVPMLIKEIQSLRNRVAQLEA